MQGGVVCCRIALGQLFCGSRTPLGRLWSPTSSLLDASWSVLGTSWSVLGASGSVLGSSGSVLGASWSQLGSSRGCLEPNLAPLGSNLELLGSLWDSTWPFQLASKRNLDSTGPLQFASKYQLDSTWPFQLASQRHLDSNATASIAIGVLSNSPSSALQVYSKCAPVGIPQGLPLSTQLLLNTPRAAECNSRALPTTLLVAGWRHMQH